MLEIFKIRWKAIAESNLKKYLLFALGEIMLVMIGILPALQIDTMVKNRENKKERLGY